MNKKTPITKEHKDESARLKKIWSSKKGDLTYEKAGDIFDISTGAVTQYLNGHTKLNLKILLKFSNLLGFEPEEVSERLCEGIELSPKNDDEGITIPMLSATASMGSGVLDLYDHDKEIKSIKATKIWLREILPSFTSTKNLRIITALGLSMKPLYNEGDLLWCDTGVKNIDHDAVYVIRVNSELFIKHAQRKPFNNTFELISENKNYDKIIVTEEDEFEVVGKILGALNFNRF